MKKSAHYRQLYLTAKEAAAVIGMTYNGVCDAARRGDLDGEKSGGAWYFRPENVRQFADKARKRHRTRINSQRSVNERLVWRE